MKEVIKHLENMAETLDGVTEENWADSPADIAAIYRSVANEIKSKMGISLENTQANPPLGEFFTDPAISSYALPLLEYKPEKPKHKNVGNIVTENTIMSYTCTFGKTVSVTARIESEGIWKFEGIINGEKTIEGLVYGGKWRAVQYIKFIRNGILSRCLKKSKANKANKEG